MRMWQVVILVNLALTVGLGVGYGAWGRRLTSLMRIPLILISHSGRDQDDANAGGAAQGRARHMLRGGPRR